MESPSLSTELLLDGFSGLNSGNELVVAELKGIREVLNNFMNHVPESIVSGFEKIIVTDRTERENFVVNREKVADRDGDSPTTPGKPDKATSTFGKAFASRKRRRPRGHVRVEGSTAIFRRQTGQHRTDCRYTGHH